LRQGSHRKRRSIDGFSLWLQEDHADAVDNLGKEHCSGPGVNSKQVDADLIDGPLPSARRAQSEMCGTRNGVDLSALARTLAGGTGCVQESEASPGSQLDDGEGFSVRA